MKNSRFVLGIAGFIGSGKSFVGEYFQGKGAKYIDADKIVDDLYEPGKDGYLKIANFFGAEYLTKGGQVNRKKLAKFVFSDPNKLKILNNLIHPIVTNQVQKMIDGSDSDLIVIEATYFDPKFLGKFVDKILWLECDRGVLLKRALKRPGMTEEMFGRILKTQVRPGKIDFIVDNNGTKAEFISRLDKIWTEIHN